MDNQVEVFGPLRAFGVKRQEIEEGILKIRISLKSNLHLNKISSLYYFYSIKKPIILISKDATKNKISVIS